MSLGTRVHPVRSSGGTGPLRVLPTVLPSPPGGPRTPRAGVDGPWRTCCPVEGRTNSRVQGGRGSLRAQGLSCSRTEGEWSSWTARRLDGPHSVHSVVTAHPSLHSTHLSSPPTSTTRSGPAAYRPILHRVRCEAFPVYLIQRRDLGIVRGPTRGARGVWGEGWGGGGRGGVRGVGVGRRGGGGGECRRGDRG